LAPNVAWALQVGAFTNLKQEFSRMRRVVICLLGLSLTLGIVGCSKEEEKPVTPAAPAAPAEGGAAPAGESK
jgi:hypothetical protein